MFFILRPKPVFLHCLQFSSILVFIFTKNYQWAVQCIYRNKNIILLWLYLIGYGFLNNYYPMSFVKKYFLKMRKKTMEKK